MEKSYKLPATLQRDYYGKAYVIEEDGETLLKSYNTIVCKVVPGRGFVRLWGGYSDTTKRHINDFRRLFDLPALNKREWNALPVENDNGERYRVEFCNGFVNWKSAVTFDSWEAAEDYGESVAEAQSYRGVFYGIMEA